MGTAINNAVLKANEVFFKIGSVFRKRPYGVNKYEKENNETAIRRQ